MPTFSDCLFGCAVGAVLFLQQRQPSSGTRAMRARTAPLSSVGGQAADECLEDEFGSGGRVNPFRASEQAGLLDERAPAFKRRESAPAAQGMREMWERAKWVTPICSQVLLFCKHVKRGVMSAEEEFSRQLGSPLGMLLEEAPSHLETRVSLEIKRVLLVASRLTDIMSGGARRFARSRP